MSEYFFMSVRVLIYLSDILKCWDLLVSGMIQKADEAFWTTGETYLEKIFKVQMAWLNFKSFFSLT